MDLIPCVCVAVTLEYSLVYLWCLWVFTMARQNLVHVWWPLSFQCNLIRIQSMFGYYVDGIRVWEVTIPPPNLSEADYVEC